MAKFNIPIREPCKPHGYPAQPRYGEKIKEQRAIEHLAEQRVIETIKNLKAEGLSLRKIAEILNQMKISTKLRGKKWHPEMIRRILQR